MEEERALPVRCDDYARPGMAQSYCPMAPRHHSVCYQAMADGEFTMVRRNTAKEQKEGRLILGTHTSESDNNYLMIAKVRLFAALQHTLKCRPRSPAR